MTLGKRESAVEKETGFSQNNSCADISPVKDAVRINNSNNLFKAEHFFNRIVIP
jgi:hypothetical protein